MRVYLASDHAGWELKGSLVHYVEEQGHEAVDLGPATLDLEDDYPDTIAPLAVQVAKEHGAFGIIIGGSGQGEAMVANRQKGVRATVFYGPGEVHGEDAEHPSAGDGFDIVRLARIHNDANVISLGARFVSENEAKEAVHLFLTTPFSGVERHVRRISKF